MKGVRVRVALIIRGEEGILLIKHKKGNDEYWLVPGGGVDFGETMEESAKREFLEETGLNVDVGRLLFTCETIGGANRHIIHFFFEGKVISGDLRLGEEENLIELKYVKIDRIPYIRLYPKVGEKIVDSINNNEFIPHHIHGNIWED